LKTFLEASLKKDLGEAPAYIASAFQQFNPRIKMSDPLQKFCAVQLEKDFHNLRPPFVFNRKSRPCSLDWRAITRATVYIAKNVARAVFRK
jgi:hypothetical protein